MMGQQQIVAAKEAGGALRRIVLALAAAVLMMASILAMAGPAMADKGGTPNSGKGATIPDKPGQNGGGPPLLNATPASGSVVFHNDGGGDTCVRHFGGEKAGEQTGGDSNACG